MNNRGNTICIYHGNCADGFTAAWVVSRALEGVELHAATHGDPPPDVTGRDVVIVDFSYKRQTMREILSACRSLVLLDHHKTAAAELGVDEHGLTLMDECSLRPDLVHGTWSTLPTIVIDQSMSGAHLAWRHFFRGMYVPPLVRYVEDRDLWRFTLPNSREVSSFIFAHDYTLAEWDALHNKTRDLLMPERPQDALDVVAGGAAILKKQDKDVRELVRASAFEVEIAGYRVPVANLPYTLSSDAAGAMAEGRPFAATYYDSSGFRTFSLRSRPGPLCIDVSEVARLFGGGGHANAAGFRVPIGGAQVRAMNEERRISHILPLS